MKNFVVYETNELISINLDGLIVKVSPLNYKQKEEIQSYFNQDKIMEGAATAMKYAIKEISGAKKSDGSDYTLKKEGEYLHSDAIDALLNTSFGPKLNIICIGLLNGIPDKFTNPETRKPLAGVSYVKDGKSGKK